MNFLKLGGSSESTRPPLATGLVISPDPFKNGRVAEGRGKGLEEGLRLRHGCRGMYAPAIMILHMEGGAEFAGPKIPRLENDAQCPVPKLPGRVLRFSRSVRNGVCRSGAGVLANVVRQKRATVFRRCAQTGRRLETSGQLLRKSRCTRITVNVEIIARNDRCGPNIFTCINP